MSNKEKQYSEHYVDRLRATIIRYKNLAKKETGKGKGNDTQSNDNRQKKHPLDFFSIWINTIIAIATIIIATYAIRQYISFKKFTTRNNRAYLSVVEPRLEAGQRYKKSRVTYIVRNSGKTPALSVKDFVYLEFRPDSIGPRIPPVTSGITEIFYNPGDNRRIKALDETNANKGWNLYFSGRIEYIDTFGDQHWTTFCYQYIALHELFSYYGDCNETDKDYNQKNPTPIIL